MDVQTIVDELKSLLEQSNREEELHKVITDRLTLLRQSFRSSRPLFSANNIDSLKQLAGFSVQLRSFIELKEELVDIDTLEDYTAVMNRLVTVKDALAPFPVCKKVKKEMRELNERLPAIRDQDEAKRQIRLNTRIIDLEQQAPHCRRNHRMVVRKGPSGYFWGCSMYPDCWQVAQLSDQERERLSS